MQVGGCVREVSLSVSMGYQTSESKENMRNHLPEVLDRDEADHKHQGSPRVSPKAHRLLLFQQNQFFG